LRHRIFLHYYIENSCLYTNINIQINLEKQIITYFTSYVYTSCNQKYLFLRILTYEVRQNLHDVKLMYGCKNNYSSPSRSSAYHSNNIYFSIQNKDCVLVLMHLYAGPAHQTSKLSYHRWILWLFPYHARFCFEYGCLNKFHCPKYLLCGY
jgi:hypothetical protein